MEIVAAQEIPLAGQKLDKHLRPPLVAHVRQAEKDLKQFLEDIRRIHGILYNNVLQSIQTIDCSNEFRLLNFQETFYSVAEEQIRKREGGALAEHRLGTLSPIRQNLLRRAVVRKAEDAGVPSGKIWYRLMDAFRMPSHLHLAPEFFDQALLYLETLDLSDETRTKRLSHGILDRKDGHR